MTGTGEHQNLDRMTRVMEALSQSADAGLRFADIVRETELGKATVHRLLAGLTAYGLVEQDAASGRYFIGMRVLTWTIAAGKRFGLARCAAEALKRLCARTQDTIYLMMRSGNEAICIDRHEGSFPIKTLTLKIGDRRPLGIGAGTLALLAFLPDDEMNRIIALQIEACAQFGVDEIALREMIATARKLGYALVDGKIITGMSAVGVPICRDDGMPIAAVSVAAISSRMRSPRQENIVANLREEVARIEADLKPLLTSGNFTFDLLRVGTT